MNTATWFALGQLIVGVLGFPLAIWQLVRTANAAERTEQRLMVNELLFELPQLHRLEQDLDDAARSSSIEGAIRVLNEWRRQAATVGAFLQTHQGDTPLLGELHNSIALAGQAKNALVNGKTNPLTVTKDARASIEKVCRDLPGVAAELKSKIGGGD